MTRFEKFLTGLKKLGPFADTVQFDNVPSVAPFSGEPEHSHLSYCFVETFQVKMWNYLDEHPEFKTEMNKLGWVSEQEDWIWVFK